LGTRQKQMLYTKHLHYTVSFTQVFQQQFGGTTVNERETIYPGQQISMLALLWLFPCFSVKLVKVQQVRCHENREHWSNTGYKVSSQPMKATADE